MLELKYAEHNLIKNFNPKAANAFPSIFLIGDKDPFACHLTTAKIARRMGAELIVEHGGGHYPMKEAPHLTDLFIARIKDCGIKYQEKKQQTTLISVEDYETFHQKPQQSQVEELVSMTEWLRNSSRAALQSTAGALNPFTRVLQ